MQSNQLSQSSAVLSSMLRIFRRLSVHLGMRLGMRLLIAAFLVWPWFTSGTGIALAQSNQPGAVYALTNAVDGNAVFVYARGADGSLTPAGSFPTGGAGSGAGLGSQNAVI